MSDDELKPCPFCGSDRINLLQSAAPWFWYKCKDCGCEGPNKDTGVAAFEAWSQRAELATLRAENERLKERDQRQHEELARLQAEWKGVQDAAVDDDPDSVESLDEWVRRVLNERFTLRQQLAEAQARVAELEAVAAHTKEILSDPHAVHINMLRGTIATPSREQLMHVLGDAAAQPETQP